MASSKSAQKSIRNISRRFNSAAKTYVKDGKLNQKKIKNLLAKAEANLNKAEELASEFERNGIEVEKGYNPERDRQFIENAREYLSGKDKLTLMNTYKITNTIAVLKDIAAKNEFTSLMKLTIDVVDTERSTDTLTVTKPVKIKLSDIYKIRRKEEAGKELTDDEFNALHAWNDATITYNNYENVPILQTEADVQAFIKASRNKSLDLSFGGQSALLNDLAYTERAKGDIGHDLVEWLRTLMQDKTVFAKIEKWYQSPSGFELRQAINAATGAAWYKQFKLISAMIDRLLDNLEVELDLGTDDMREQLRSKANAITSGYMDDY